MDFHGKATFVGGLGFAERDFTPILPVVSCLDMKIL